MELFILVVMVAIVGFLLGFKYAKDYYGVD